MFAHQGRYSGWIEVVCGPMFSGKTEELIRRLKLVQIAKQRVQIFKPVIDDRYDEAYIMSHSAQRFECEPVSTAKEILDKIHDNTRVVGIDEAQFYSEEIADVAVKLANRGLRVILAGLDQDYKGRPFGSMPTLLALAESVLKLKAICKVCGGLASKTQRLTTDQGTVVVGSGEAYEARCRACFDPDLSVERAVPALPLSKKKKHEPELVKKAEASL
ncbi:MAG: thymidine kinase [Deltaproteobacteria bacterium CG_4_10_14_0_2_um_filter_43_8]|nr:MAG: thymidine kinase [Deltaproteobacteria bacterium CG11_big_fil_rev_8_21_14_0_20_42_23]PJA21662.1 MAG: thymidine kinase [Deltaproteobacteria bacterium CG_4_10_14_0_2_um_filter_43_8]PJC64294.1 MAG: thymidine kinase [Deltaproteobacteria bacterium CG_4_9_14_0_2_um_filter_42_21]